MHGDPKFTKFFLYLNLFVFSMLMLVLGDNLLLTFLGWEGVGACSYFLISFWHTDDANASAGKKAFVTNRIGDFGFMVAMFFTFVALGSISYVDIAAGAGGLAAIDRHRDRRCCSSWARPASRPSCRCSCGCPTPWPARPRCPRSSTPPPWSPPACTCSPA